MPLGVEDTTSEMPSLLYLSAITLDAVRRWAQNSLALKESQQGKFFHSNATMKPMSCDRRCFDWPIIQTIQRSQTFTKLLVISSSGFPCYTVKNVPVNSKDGSNNVVFLESFGDSLPGMIMKTLSLAIASKSKVVLKLLQRMVFIMVLKFLEKSLITSLAKGFHQKIG